MPKLTILPYIEAMSDETTKSMLKKITVNYSSPKQIPGASYSSDIFYDCAKLTPGDLARLAAEATGDLDSTDFDYVIGIAYSGILFASAVAGGRFAGILGKDDKIYGPAIKGANVLIVDDVIYSGNQVLRAAKIVEQAGAKIVGFACVVDRSKKGGELNAKPLYSAFQG